MYLPADLYSIHDVNEWRGTFLFPVSLRDGEIISEHLYRFLVDLYYDLNDDDLKGYFRIASKELFYECYNLEFKMLLSQRMRQLKNLRFFQDNYRRPANIELPNISDVMELYHGRPCINFRFFEAVLNLRREGLITRTLKNVYHHFRGRRRTTLGKAEHLVLGANEYTLKYVQHHCNKNIYLLRNEDIFESNRRDIHSSKLPRDLVRLVDRLGEVAALVWKEIGGGESTLADRLVNALMERSTTHFRAILFDCAQAQKFFQRLSAKAKLYTGTGKYPVRVCSEVIRQRGNEVTAFSHGGGLGHVVYPETVFLEFATCDNFVCFDEGEAAQFKTYRQINKIRFPVLSDIGISWYDVDKSSHISTGPIDLKNIRCIMYVPTGDQYDTFYFGSMPDLVHFDMQLEVIDYLLGLGKRIIIKSRPKNVYKNVNLLGYYDGKVEYWDQPFLEVMHFADLFVFEGKGSSALHEACTLTDTPVILLDRVYPRFTSEALAVLKRRCHVIPMYEDDRNGLRFDKGELDKVLLRQRR